MICKTTIQHSKIAKNKDAKFFSCAALFLFLGISAHSQYCQPDLDCTDGDLITNVTLSTLSNPSTCGTFGYSDFTSLAAPSLAAGQSYPISVAVGNGWPSESVSVWIDYNSNSVFDASEFTFIATGSGNTVTGNIAVPAGATSGSKRMRVRVAAVGAASATSGMSCDEDQGYGETEDYTVNITALGVHDFEAAKIAVVKNHQTFDVKSPNTPIESVSLCDVSGKLVFERSGINQTDFNIPASGLSNQVLVLRITTSEGMTFVKKLIN